MAAALNAAKERPILFSGPMVRAILEGRKSQTRRLLRVPDHPAVADWVLDSEYRAAARAHSEAVADQYVSTFPHGRVRCPYGVPGDRLWVRETFCTCYDGQEAYEVIYAADNTRRGFSTASNATDDQLDWLERSMTTHGERGRPAIHMPRWACRLVLEVTASRVERLQDISEDDARAEGCEQKRYLVNPFKTGALRARFSGEVSTFKESYALLWDSLNAKRSPWASNPWVWAITFRRTHD